MKTGLDTLLGISAAMTFGGRSSDRRTAADVCASAVGTWVAIVYRLLRLPAQLIEQPSRLRCVAVAMRLQDWNLLFPDEPHPDTTGHRAGLHAPPTGNPVLTLQRTLGSMLAKAAFAAPQV